MALVLPLFIPQQALCASRSRPGCGAGHAAAPHRPAVCRRGRTWTRATAAAQPDRSILECAVARAARSAGGVAATRSRELASVAIAAAAACCSLSRRLATWEVRGASTSEVSQRNASGDEQKPLDLVADALFAGAFEQSGVVGLLASEERDSASVFGAGDGPLVVAMDPLDGSRNIECSIPTGTIFGVFGRCQDTRFSDLPLQNDVAFQEVRTLACDAADTLLLSGYCLYSSATVLVLAVRGGGVSQWVLDATTGEWLCVTEHTDLPARGQIYSLNDGRYFDWPEGLRRYIDAVRGGNGQTGKKYSARYVCSLVADFHRTLKYGGWAGNPRPHLRILYEGLPLALVAKESGGAASDGKCRFLSGPGSPESMAFSAGCSTLHARASLFAGSLEDLLELEGYGDVQQGAAQYDV